ncbi:MAG: hypothetical protein ACK4PI_00630 [Tepidisphaerales bacterium]
MVWLVALSAAMSGVMCGLVWFVQLVHYPLMSHPGHAGEGRWSAYHAGHTTRTTWVVAPAMVGELATAAALLVWLGASGAWWVWAQAALAALAWAVTFALQVPQHGRLSRGFDADLHRRLVAGNWVRVVIWTARFVLMLTVLAAGWAR